MDDQSIANYAQPLYSTIHRNGDRRSATKRPKPSPENDDQVHSSIMNEERRITESSIHDPDRLNDDNLTFVGFGSDTDTVVKASLPDSASPEPTMTSLIDDDDDDDSLAQLLAHFDAQLSQTMLSLDEAEKSIERESNKQQQQQQQQQQQHQQQQSKKDRRMNGGVVDEQQNTSGDPDIAEDEDNRKRKDQSQQDEWPSIERLVSSIFDRDVAPTFSSFKGPTAPPGAILLQKKMVTFDDRIQTFARPQSVHENEVSYNDANDNERRQLHQQPPPQQQEEQERDASRDGEHSQRERQSRRHDAAALQSQQPVINENDIYEDVYARQSNSLVANADSRRYDAIPTGNEPEESRVKVKVKTSTAEDFYDRQEPGEDALAAAADVNDEFLSLGSEDDEEDDEEDEDTDFMIREMNGESAPVAKVKALTVGRTLAVILAWLLAGVVAELPGPTMQYWSDRFSVSGEHLSRVFATDGLGIVLGSLLGGAASCRRHSDSALAVAMVLLASYPCTHSFAYYQLTSFMCAVARGSIFVGGLSVVVEMWKESRAAIWIHILHTSYSIGCFLAVHLAAPFVHYLFQVEGRLLWSDLKVQQMRLPSLVVQGAQADAGNTTAEDAGDMMEMLNSMSASQQVSPTSPASAAAASDRILVSLHLLQIPFVIVCLLLSLFFLCNSILRTIRSVRRQSILRRNRLRRQEQRNRNLKRGMPPTSPPQDPEQRSENQYEDTQKDKETDAQGDGDKDGNKIGIGQAEIHSSVADPKKNGFGVQAKNGFLNDAFTHAPGHEEFGAVEFKGGNRSAGSRRCVEELQPDYKGTTSKRNRPKSKVAKKHVPWFQGDQTFDVPILMFLYVCFVFPFGLEATLGMFLSVYASRNKALQQLQQQQHLESAAADDDDDGASDIDVTVQLLSVFWASFILGRILAASLSRILSAGALLIVCLAINVLSSAILSAYADKYSTVLWLFVAIFGGFLGPFVPGGFSWANAFLVATPKSIALAYCSAGLGWTICCWLSGFLISYFSSSTLMYLVAALSSLSVLLFIPVLMKLGAPGSKLQRNRVARRKPLSTYV